MDLLFKPHARDSMHERRIPETAVYPVVEDADLEINRDDDRTEYHGTWEGRTLLIVLEGGSEPREVVTVVVRKVRRPRRR